MREDVDHVRIMRRVADVQRCIRESQDQAAKGSLTWPAADPKHILSLLKETLNDLEKRAHRDCEAPVTKRPSDDGQYD